MRAPNPCDVHAERAEFMHGRPRPTLDRLAARPRVTHINPSWAHYPDTILELRTPSATHVLDLRQPLSPADQAALGRLGGSGPFAVVTACSPHGRPSDAEANAAHSARLEAELRGRDVLLARATGRSPDRAHAEPGFACTLSRDEAVAVARRYGQSALFWYDGDRVWVVGACVDAADLPLPRGHDSVRVVAAVVERAGRLLVCQRPPHKRHGGLWEFPGGKCEPGESDADAAGRELREELGVRVTAVGAEAFAIADPGSPFLIAFLPVAIAGDPVCHEHTALTWRTPAELTDLPLAPSDRRFVEHLLSARDAGQMSDG